MEFGGDAGDRRVVLQGGRRQVQRLPGALLIADFGQARLRPNPSSAEAASLSHAVLPRGGQRMGSTLARLLRCQKSV